MRGSYCPAYGALISELHDCQCLVISLLQKLFQFVIFLHDFQRLCLPDVKLFVVLRFELRLNWGRARDENEACGQDYRGPSTWCEHGFVSLISEVTRAVLFSRMRFSNPNSAR